MDVKDAIKVIARTAGVPLSHMGPAIGKSSGWGTMSVAANRASVNCSTAATIAHLCGYRLELVPVDADRPPGSIPIDAPADVERIEPLGKPYI